MRKGHGYRQIYSVLVTKKQAGEPVTIQELGDVAGLKVTTARVYYRNRLKNKFLTRRADGSFDVTDEIERFDEEQFADWMSQNTVAAPDERELWQNLLDNANQSLLAAIEIHNKPVFHYRYQVCQATSILTPWRHEN